MFSNNIRYSFLTPKHEILVPILALLPLNKHGLNFYFSKKIKKKIERNDLFLEGKKTIKQIKSLKSTYLYTL